MALNFGPPVIDFSPLAKLGTTYDAARKSQTEYDMTQARQGALASLAQGADPKAIGQAMLKAGDLEGGLAALRLAESQTSSAASRGIEERRLAESIREHRETLDASERERGRAEAQREYERNKPGRVTGRDEFGDPKYGNQDPRTGVIHWDDGTTSQGVVGPQSGGAGDPNLPAPGALPAEQPGSGAPGYSIPSTGQVVPALRDAPMQTDLPVPGAAPAQTAIAPNVQAQAAPPASAAAGQAAAAGAPVTSSMINQGTANIAPMTNEEMKNEARRLGISPGQYRAARAEAIKKEMEAKVGGKPLTEAQDKAQIGARRMEGAEREFRPLAGASQSLAERAKATAPVVGPWWASDEYKGAAAAKKEWIEGLLRPVSGASIRDDEYANYDAMYFPQLGDGPNVVAQKERARERALRGVKAGLPADAIARMESQYKDPLSPAPGVAGNLKSGSAGVLRFDRDGNPVK